MLKHKTRCIQAQSPRNNPAASVLEGDSCDCLVISVRSFGTHLHLFPALKSPLSGHHFRNNEEMQQAVNFLRSLGTDFHQDGFLKLNSRYDKCINVGGKYSLQHDDESPNGRNRAVCEDLRPRPGAVSGRPPEPQHLAGPQPQLHSQQ
ncbi:hypothetical protein AVEN_145930-1 [Araneus ventricosus]|uniref:Uncharacterized protein n=1 Tax=Araneus ventricosus TaxID=182803 RepID=A0A4Y2GLX2_ARAVE|nr:hypothetical protein AVEN_145930-1 [Araneus ventricosus]